MTAPVVVDDADLAAIRRSQTAATQWLLGETITISDADWRQPTVLPGWTRAHLATHIARNADALRRAVTGLMDGAGWSIGDDDTLRDLEVGSRRSPLDLQIDLDTSASRLDEAFSQLTAEQWRAPVADGVVVADLPLARLNEVVLHHVDLDCGFGFVDVEPDVARWLLEWNVRRHTDGVSGRAVVLVSSGGYQARLGTETTSAPVVTGSDAMLLGWLTGRLPASAVAGADHIEVVPPR